MVSAFLSWPHISPGNLFSSPSHTHPSRRFSVMDFSSQSWSGRGNYSTSFTDNKEIPPPPWQPLRNQNKQKFSFNPALAKCHSAVGKSSSFSCSPDQNPLIPRKRKIKLGTCGNGGGISPLLPSQELFGLGSVPLGGREKRIIVTSWCLGHNSVINKQLQVLEPWIFE